MGRAYRVCGGPSTISTTRSARPSQSFNAIAIVGDRPNPKKLCAHHTTHRRHDTIDAFRRSDVSSIGFAVSHSTIYTQKMTKTRKNCTQKTWIMERREGTAGSPAADFQPFSHSETVFVLNVRPTNGRKMRLSAGNSG